jgi:Asparagine synthase
MVSKVFGGLSFSGEERLICAKMASAAHRWPFVKLKTGIFDGSWFGETLPGYGKPHWYVNETNELIYGKRDTIRDSKEPSDPSSFAIEIIFRPQTGEIELWSGIGATPLFYAFDAANLITGSDPTVVCAALKSSPELDPAGIMSLFALEYQTPARSLFKEVKRLPPLHRIKGGAEGWSEPVSYVKPFVFSFPKDGSTSISDAAECLIRAVADAVREREGVCLPLTGGADSRTILASTPSCERLQAYTRGTPRDAEVVTATKLAKIAGIPHRCFPFPDDYLEKSFPRVVHLTGGCVPANHSHAIHPLGQLAKQTVDTVLPGTNGGFGRSFRATEHFAGTSGATDFWNRFFALNFKFNEQTMTNVFHPPWSDAVLSTIPDLRHEYAADLPVNGTTPQVDLDWIHLLRRIPHFTVWGPYVWNSAFQVVMPFMNFDYLKAVAGLPSWQRSNPAVHASVMKSRNPRFLKIPLVPSGRMLKPEIGERWRVRWRLKKASLMGISQLGPQRYDLWLRKEAAFVESVLFSSHAADRRLFRIEETRKLWHEHLGGGNQTAMLCKLLTLELACRINVDGMSVKWNEF